MRYRRLFPELHTLFVVIHVLDYAQALNNVLIAHGCGVKGAFLINHGMSDEGLVDIYRRVHAHLQVKRISFFLGINCLNRGLGAHPERTFDLLPRYAEALWLETIGVDGRDPHFRQAQRIADEHRAFKERTGSECLLFGGFAFKGQYPVADEKLASLAAVVPRYADVLTTSGPGTGHAPQVDKIETIKRAVGNFPVAIASGMSAGNIRAYGAADAYMVASSIIGAPNETFSVTRVKQLRQEVGAMSGG